VSENIEFNENHIVFFTNSGSETMSKDGLFYFNQEKNDLPTPVKNP